MRTIGIYNNLYPVTTNPKGRNNAHLCITGQSGTGKSTFAEYLICQEVRKGKRCIVFNWHNCMDRRSMNPVLKEIYESEVKVFNVATDGLPLPLFCPMPDGKGGLETEKMIIKRLTETIADACGLAKTYKETVFEAFCSIFEDYPEDKSFKGLIRWLSDQEDATSKNTLARIRNLCDEGLIYEGDFLECESNLIEIDLNDLPSHAAQKEVLTFIMDHLSRVAGKGRFTEQDYLTVFIDEAQNLEYKKHSVMEIVLNEIRRCNIKLILALPSLYTKDKTLQQAILQCATLVYFKPKVNDIANISKSIDKKTARSITTGLKRLEIGEFYADGRFLVKGKVHKESYIKAKLDLCEEVIENEIRRESNSEVHRLETA